MSNAADYCVTGDITVTFRDDELLRSFAKSEAARRHSVATSFATGVRPGDRITMSRDTNRVRRIVVDVGSATHFETVTHIRPSRGYAKYVRRMKSALRP